MSTPRHALDSSDSAEYTADAAAAESDNADTSTSRRFFHLGLFLCLPFLHLVSLFHFCPRFFDASLRPVPAAGSRYVLATAVCAFIVTASLGAWVAGAQAARIAGALPPSFFVYVPTSQWWAAGD